MNRAIAFLAILLLAAGLLLTPSVSQALPSYARQAGMSCAMCHTVYPELTQFGRRFKLGGYILTGTPSLGDPDKDYVLNTTPPISVLFQVSLTQTDKDQPDANAGNLSAPAKPVAQNGTVEMPQQLSLFYAGRISPNIGSFIQFTWTAQDNHFSLDNTDIRIVGSGTMGESPLVYGLTINNNPTVQDLWNTTAAWGFPFQSSGVAPSPAAATLLDGTLGGAVAGVGGYVGLLKDDALLYGELSFYRTIASGTHVPLDSTSEVDVIQDVAPYLRFAYERSFGTSNWEVGVIAMDASFKSALGTQPGSGCPGGALSGTDNVNGNAVTVTCTPAPAANAPSATPTNQRTDFGVDAQVQLMSSDTNIITIRGIYLHEDQKWGSNAANGFGSAANATDTLDTMRISGSYYRNRTHGLHAGYFSTTGSTDTGLYASGKPDSSGEVLEYAYTPWLNTRFSLQYVTYEKFDGVSDHASDMNTWYALMWLMF